MPTQPDPPLPSAKGEPDFDSPYLDMRVALNSLEQLGFIADRQAVTLYWDDPPPRVHIDIGWPVEPAAGHDRDVFAQLIEDSGRPISRCGAAASVDIGRARLTLNGAFPHPELIGERRPTIDDLYLARPGDRAARGKLNPLFDSILTTWTREVE